GAAAQRATALHGRNVGSPRAADGGRERGDTRGDVVHGVHRRVTHYRLFVDASHGTDPPDHFGGDYCVLSGNHDFPDLCHGPSAAGCGQRAAGLVSIGLRSGNEMGRARMTGKPSAKPVERLPSVVVHAVLALMLAVAILPVSARADDEVFASVGTGQLNGIYYPVGKAICQIANRDLHTHGVRCSPEATPGSVYNMAALKSGGREFALVPSDVQFAAEHGAGNWD